MKRLRSSSTLFLVLLLAISAYVWRLLPSQVIRGDGFVYLISQTQQEFFSRKFFYTGFELSGASLGWLFSRLYGINISWYWWTAYIVMLVTNALFYWLAFTIFKRPLLAFVAAIFFALNFFGNWDMYSSHCYCFFIERIIPVLFLLPAGVYLHRFLEKKKRRDGLVSFALYFLGIGIGHWSVFITAFFLFYPLCWALFPSKGRRRPQVALLGGAYLGITIFFVLIQRIHEAGFGPTWSAVEFFFHPETYLWPQKILRQFVHWTQYPVLLSGNFITRMVGRISDMKAIEAITPYIVLLYIIVFGVVYRNLASKRALLVTVSLGTISLFFLNSFFGQYDVLYQPGSNRYLFYPTMLLAFFWALFIEVLLIGKRKLLRWTAIVLLVGYTYVNMTLIGESYMESMGYNAWTKRVYEYIQTHAQKLPLGTLVVAPYDEVGVYEAKFFTEQLAPRGIKVMSVYNTYPETNMWERVASTSAHVITLEKNKACRCITERILK